MKKFTRFTLAAMTAVAIAGGIAGCGSDSSSAATDVEAAASEAADTQLAQAPVPIPGVTEPTPAASEEAEAAAEEAATDEEPSEALADKPVNEAPEVTKVSGQLVGADGKQASGGVVYFVFQSRLNEIPHSNPLEKVRAMAEEAVAVDAQGSFTLRMKPGNFAMIYDPSATEVPTEPGPESLAATKALTPEQVQSRVAAIKENASQGLPIKNGKLGDAFVIENRFIRPPISNFGELQLQDGAVVTVKAVMEGGELINFPATLRLRGKNGDIMQPHMPSVSTRAQYSFHDLLPQSYQVFALGTRPRPGAGDEITTPTVSNDQFVFTGDSFTHEAVVEMPTAE